MKLDHFVVERPVTSKKTDTGLLVSMVLLLGLGLLTLYFTSADYGLRFHSGRNHFIKQQIFPVIIGLVCMTIMACINLELIRKLMPWILFGTLVLNVLPLIFSYEVNGSKRWLKIFSYTLQPSDVAKLVIVLFLANLFDKKKDRINDVATSIAPAIIVLFLFVGIVILQNDYATSMLILLLGLLLFFISGVSMRWFGAFLVFSVPIALIFIFVEKYRVDRLIAFLNPKYDIQGINYQVNASKIAINAGGFWGQGMGTGLEKIKSIPEVHADFVFAGWAEAMGFIGVIGYFALLGYFAYKVFNIAAKCEDFFRSLLAFGCGAIIVVQSLVNCGVVCGALPSTGIPLPFFSHGGTSMLMTLVTCGVIINISRYENVSELMYE